MSRCAASCAGKIVMNEKSAGSPVLCEIEQRFMSTAQNLYDIHVLKYDAEQHKSLWDDFVCKAKNSHFMFYRNYMDYHSDRFTDNSLMFYDNTGLIAVLPASLHGTELRSHGGLTYGGFITDNNMKQHKMLKCFDALKQYMHQENISTLIYKAVPHIFHRHPAEEDLYALFKCGAELLKIEPSTTVILRNPVDLPKGRKAQISRAKREGVSVERSEDFDAFIDLENSVLQKYHRTMAVHTAAELKLLKSRFKNEIQLWIAKSNNEMIAGTLLFICGDVVHTQYMAASDKARKIGGLDLLIKTLLDKYSESKTYFDFGISTEDNGNFLNEGLCHQKESFGGRTVVYETWKINQV